MTHPFSYEEALEIIEDFEDLIDTDISIGGKMHFIENVLVCPFNEPDRSEFMAGYRQTGETLPPSGKYSAGEFDVIVLIGDTDNEENRATIDIRTFIARQGIRYNFPAD